MLAHRLWHFPYGRHAGRKRDEITLAKAYRLTPVRCDNHIAFEEVTNLLFVVMPRKFRDFLRPNAPAVNTEFVEPLWIRIAFDLYLVHGVNDSSSFLISVSFPSALDSV